MTSFCGRMSHDERFPSGNYLAIHQRVLDDGLRVSVDDSELGNMPELRIFIEALLDEKRSTDVDLMEAYSALSQHSDQLNRFHIKYEDVRYAAVRQLAREGRVGVAFCLEAEFNDQIEQFNINDLEQCLKFACYLIENEHFELAAHLQERYQERFGTDLLATPECLASASQTLQWLLDEVECSAPYATDDLYAFLCLFPALQCKAMLTLFKMGKFTRAHCQAFEALFAASPNDFWFKARDTFAEGFLEVSLYADSKNLNGKLNFVLRQLLPVQQALELATDTLALFSAKVESLELHIKTLEAQRVGVSEARTFWIEEKVVRAKSWLARMKSIKNELMQIVEEYRSVSTPSALSPSEDQAPIPLRLASAEMAAIPFYFGPMDEANRIKPDPKQASLAWCLGQIHSGFREITRSPYHYMNPENEDVKILMHLLHSKGYKYKNFGEDPSFRCRANEAFLTMCSNYCLGKVSHNQLIDYVSAFPCVLSEGVSDFLDQRDMGQFEQRWNQALYLVESFQGEKNPSPFKWRSPSLYLRHCSPEALLHLQRGVQTLEKEVSLSRWSVHFLFYRWLDDWLEQKGKTKKGQVTPMPSSFEDHLQVLSEALSTHLRPERMLLYAFELFKSEREFEKLKRAYLQAIFRQENVPARALVEQAVGSLSLVDTTEKFIDLVRSCPFFKWDEIKKSEEYSGLIDQKLLIAMYENDRHSALVAADFMLGEGSWNKYNLRSMALRWKNLRLSRGEGFLFEGISGQV